MTPPNGREQSSIKKKKLKSISIQNGGVLEYLQQQSSPRLHSQYGPKAHSKRMEPYNPPLQVNLPETPLHGHYLDPTLSVSPTNIYVPIMSNISQSVTKKSQAKVS